MTEEMKEALKEYLKENLRIEVSKHPEYGSDTDKVEISIHLDGEEISSDYFYMD